MASRYWVNGTGTWDAATTTHWSAAAPITFTASCSSTTLTTTGSPSLVNGMTVWANNGTSLGTITGGSVNTWTVSVGGTYTSQTMSAATTGASVPTSSDDVFFVTGSNTGSYTVTTNVSAGAPANNLSLAGPVTGSLTISTLGTNALAVSGNYLSTGNVAYTTSLGNIVLKGSTSGLTFDTGNVSNFPAVWQVAAGATYTLANNFNADINSGGIRGSFRLDAGTFDTANYTMTVTRFNFNNSPGTAKSFIGRNSNLIATDTAFPWNASSDSGLTLSVATTNLIFTGTSAKFDVGNYTYGNVLANSTALANFTLTNPNDSNISGTLTVGPRTSSGLGYVNIGVVGANIRIGNISILSGTDATMRTKFYCDSALFGSTQSGQVYCNGSVAFTNVDFAYIDARGTTTPWTGNNIGNAGGTSNITGFAASKTVYSVATDNANWSSNIYSTTQGGTANPNSFPLPQDTLIFDATHPPAGKTITFDGNYFIGNVDASARTTNSITFAAGSNAITFVGNTTLTSNITVTGSGSSYGPILLAPSAPANITTGNITFPGNITKVGSSNITLNDKLLTTGNLQLYYGNIILNNNTMNASTFSTAGTSTRSLNFGTSGVLNLNGSNTTVWNVGSVQGFTVSGTTNVNLTYSGSTGTRTLYTTPLGVGGFGNDANIPAFNVTAGSDTVALTFGNAVRDLNFTGFSGTFNPSTSTYCYGNLTLSSTMNAVTVSTTINLLGGNANLGLSRTLTANGKMGNMGINLNYDSGSNVTMTLQDDYAMTASTSQAVTVTSGTLDLNSHTLTTNSFSFSGTSVKAITFGSGTMNLFGSGTSFNAAAASANTTINGGTGKIVMSNATTAKTFSGGNRNFNGVSLYQGGAGNLTIAGNNIFDTLGSNVANTAIIFTGGTTTTVNTFSMTGNSGNLITLKSTVAGSQFKLSKSSGTVSGDYLSISDSNAIGGASWYAGANSSNVANVVGWIFSAAPIPSGGGINVVGGTLFDTSSGGITFTF